MSIEYSGSPTTLPDLYGMYNPFAYPQAYTRSMESRTLAMMEDSVQRGLRRYFDDNAIPEFSLVDRGAEFQVVSTVHGYAPSELKIENRGGFLTISGEKSQKYTSPDRQAEAVSHTSFRRTFRVPSKGKASAALLGSKLTISIPK